MISSEGEFRNGKKYAELAYLLPISGNSGIQKWMASTANILIQVQYGESSNSPEKALTLKSFCTRRYIELAKIFPTVGSTK